MSYSLWCILAIFYRKNINIFLKTFIFLKKVTSKLFKNYLLIIDLRVSIKVIQKKVESALYFSGYLLLFIWGCLKRIVFEKKVWKSFTLWNVVKYVCNDGFYAINVCNDEWVGKRHAMTYLMIPSSRTTQFVFSISKRWLRKFINDEWVGKRDMQWHIWWHHPLGQPNLLL